MNTASKSDIVSSEGHADDVGCCSFSEQIMSLLEPVSKQSPSGEDPRYGENFVIIKQEIDKFSGNDFEAVVRHAEFLLKDEAKDLRVAGYYLFAKTYVQGLSGLIDGVQLYSGMLLKYGNTMFPVKESSRSVALAWLNNSKLTCFFEKAIAAANLAELEIVKHAVNTISVWSKNVFGNEAPQWSVADDSIKKLESDLRRINDISENVDNNNETDSSLSNSVSECDDTPGYDDSLVTLRSGPDSDSSLLDTLRHSCLYLIENGDYVHAVSLSRSARWGGLRVPPNEKNKTRIPLPRMSALADIKNFADNNNYFESFSVLEKFIFEPGAHLLFDAQCYGVRMLREWGRHDIADEIERQCCHLILRIPGIEVLCFEDGTPFSSPETLGWLNGLMERNNTVNNNTSLDEHSNEDVDALRAKIKSNGFNMSISELDGLTFKSNLSSVKFRLIMAELCLEMDLFVKARALLDALSEESEKTHLAKWIPDIAFSIEHMRLKAVEGFACAFPGEEGEGGESLRETIRKRMFEIDFSKALRVSV